MGEFKYRLQGVVGLAEIIALRDRAREAFDNFTELGDADRPLAFFEFRDGLPELPASEGIEIIDLDSTGRLSTKEDPWATFDAIASAGKPIADIGRLAFNCGFEEKSSDQDEDGYDAAWVVAAEGRVSFGYTASGSLPGLNAEYGKTVLREAIEKLH